MVNHAFLSSNPARRLGIGQSKANTAKEFISQQIQAKVSGEGRTKQYSFVLQKLRSKNKEDANLLPSIYLGLARNASAISGDNHSKLVRPTCATPSLHCACFVFLFLAPETPKIPAASSRLHTPFRIFRAGVNGRLTCARPSSASTGWVLETMCHDNASHSC